MMPRSIVEPGLSLCCPRKDPSDGRCHDRFAEEQFPAVRLPSMSREFERLARDAAATNQNYFEFLLRLAESELATALPLRSRGGSKTRSFRS